MKNVSITSQLILLSLSVVLLASAIFTIVTLNGIYRFAEAEVYSRLQSYATIVKTNPQMIYPVRDDLETEYYAFEAPIYYKSDSLYEVIDEATLKNIISSLKKRNELETGGIVVKEKMQNKNQDFYYIFISNPDSTNYIFMITNSNYVSYVVRNVSIQIISIFILTIMLYKEIHV